MKNISVYIQENVAVNESPSHPTRIKFLKKLFFHQGDGNDEVEDTYWTDKRPADRPKAFSFPAGSEFAFKKIEDLNDTKKTKVLMFKSDDGMDGPEFTPDHLEDLIRSKKIKEVFGHSKE